ncbi:MAG: methyltransferase domain-containing protein [Deltaproteobacteria bacterium]|nr:methyltransferase domain-containing protein [Deltaproteobacteria bacterium]
MRNSLLDYICCPHCGKNLTGSDTAVEIEKGVLICEKCSRWFPISNFVPELLPDHLRDWDADLALLDSLESQQTKRLFRKLRRKSKTFQKKAAGVQDSGLAYKKSEISIKNKVSQPDFFGPGYCSPFNPGNTEYTIQLIRRFGNVLPLLEIGQGDVVLDVGAGYAWTTEWLKKMGIESIGVDICRTYLDIALQRMDRDRPHLIIADVENLPIQTDRLHAVLCFDAFHHIHDRERSMRHFLRALKKSGRIVLAEPGEEHEMAEVSQDVMEKYGILEKGMSLSDVEGYCRGLALEPPEQHFILNINNREQAENLSREFVASHSYLDCNFYVIKKTNDS